MSGPRPPGAGRAVLVVPVLVVCVLGPSLAACGGLGTRTDRAPVSRAVLTPDAGDRYTFTGSAQSVVVAAPATNRGRNLRTVFWPDHERQGTDEESCAVWQSATGVNTQQGVALRIVHDAGRVRAVTVTKNVYAAFQWRFNVHVWDTAATPTGTMVAQFDLTSVFYRPGGLVPLPWHVCARVLGDRVSFKAWPDSAPVPAWGDPRSGGSATLPAGWVYPGRAGWYAGHLDAGDSATFTDLAAGPLPP